MYEGAKRCRCRGAACSPRRARCTLQAYLESGRVDGDPGTFSPNRPFAGSFRAATAHVKSRTGFGMRRGFYRFTGVLRVQMDGVWASKRKARPQVTLHARSRCTFTVARASGKGVGQVYPTGPQQPYGPPSYGYGAPPTRPLPSMVRTYSDERAYHIDLQLLSAQDWQVAQVTPVSRGTGAGTGCSVAGLGCLTVAFLCVFWPVSIVTGLLAIVVGIMGAGGGGTSLTVTYVAPYGVTPHPAMAPGAQGNLVGQILDAPLPRAFELAANRLASWFTGLSTGWKVAVVLWVVVIVLGAAVGVALLQR